MTWEDSKGEPADYAVVWRPPVEMLRGRTDLKAVFNLGAGVDAILRLRDEDPDALPAGVPTAAGRCRHGSPDGRVRERGCTALLPQTR